MTEITRVPLQPIAKGSLSKLWLGVAAAVLAAGALAWAAMPAQVKIQTLVAGEGPSPTISDVAMVKIKGTLRNGKVFQPEAQGPLEVAGVIPGFTKALMHMQKGGKYHVEIPASLGYGDKPQGEAGEIPANSDLYFDIDLIDFKSRAEIEQQQAMMQQIQRMQAQRQHGGRGAPPPGAESRIPEGAMPDGATPETPPSQ
jgi:FKBP-type peptidyl-prolyl cis-trans isomerase FkpA